ncbi:MAG: SpoIID/LytB domain-containing protein [Armatimonadota bacterium]|nr:SpoIID/LytB domain-containing protein [Armatimonadota bacterium]MDR7427275.1 SpoIID/LytB domain-containing protein [Armatimonadota bacterium]MDR7463151.1 SpoIID/LytB domain-containing protein [Armatimonadota bacterium]MDR7468862.1 SpoIID/LytB domain-containing protein [Armatimonadota bacterium]MDR7474897.1 SpoIID/LytB domain-containing protein [Armatimonadota bacterium]
MPRFLAATAAAATLAVVGGMAWMPGAASQVGASTAQLVRVGILLGQEAIPIVSEGAMEAGDVAAQAVVRLPPGTYEFRPAPQGIEGAGTRFGPVLRLRSQVGWLAAGPRRYRGVIELRRTPQGLTAINELFVEEYLYGVLKMEVDPRWPVEALKAQAVAARTLALYSLGRFAAEGYDLRATTDSQVYAGMNAEDPRTTAAVEATRGVIMTYGGRPVFAAFHADSGGTTESSEFVWGQPYPYLRGVADPYGQDAPYREWLSRIDLPTLEARLANAGRPLAGISAVTVTATSPSGRALTVRLRGAGGTLELRAVDLRTLLGVTFLRSTLFTVRPADDDSPAVEFWGRGSGHGVGMSQWGARGQALLGRAYPDILAFYYQGIQLETR